MKKFKKQSKSKGQFIDHLRKISLVVLCGYLSVFGLLAANNQKKDATLSVNVKNKTLVQVLDEIEKKSGYLFFYYDGFVDSNRKIQLKADNQTIVQLLDKLFENTENTYLIDGRQVFVRKRSKAASSQQKNILVTGTVLDESGEPLVGSTISVKGTANIAVADVNGDYSITVPDDQVLLVASHVGFVTQPFSVRSARRVVMKVSVNSIENVVVTGIFNRKAEGYTGSTVSITGKDLKRVGNQNLFQSLKNIDPSLYIISNLTMGSDPNTLPDMQLRGTSTFSTDETTSLKGYYQGKPNTPLFILDGFETTLERVYDMDMNRIETLTILKDASAKAIYGSKAANGVVVIETKKLKTDETRVTYNGSVSFEMPDLSSYNLCNALEKLQAEKIEGYYDKAVGIENQAAYQKIYNERLKSALEGESTYWLSKPLRVGIGNKHSVTVEMGEKNLKSVADFSYNHIEGAMKGSDNTTISGDVNISYRHKNILFKNIMEIVNKESNDSPYGDFSTYAKMNPYWSPYDSDGKVKQYVQTANAIYTESIANPLYDATLNILLRNTYMNFNNNFYVEADFLKNFKAKVSLGISSKRFDDEDFYPSDHSKFSGVEYNTEETKMLKGSYDMTNGKSSSITGKFDLQYNKSLGKHNFFADITYELSQTKYNETSIQAEGFPSGRVNNIGFARQYAEGTTPASYDAINRDLGFLEYFSYNYDNRYVTDLTFRTNASSVFGNDNPWANFWSAGLGWNINNEAFMKGIKDLRTLKVRGSYGTSGNQNFAQNVSYATYAYNTTGQYQSFIGAILQNMENPTLKWEQKKEANVGLDLIYKDLSLKIDYYDANTENMVTNLSIVPSTGFSTVRDNLGEVSNKGWEMNLGYTLLRNKKGFLNVNGSISTNENKIVRISEGLRKFNESQMVKAARGDQALPVLMYVDGMPLNAIWAVPSLGIDPVNGHEVFLNQKGEKTYTWSATNLVYCGTSTPKYNGIVGVNGEYNGFGVSVTATFLGGCHAYNQTLEDRVENIDMLYNIDKRVLIGRWNTPGQNAQYTALTSTWTNPETGLTVTSVTNATSRFVQKRDEFTLSSISAYYDFSRNLIEKMKFKQLRLSFYINDIYTWSTIQIERGTSYPFARNMSFSLTGTF